MKTVFLKRFLTSARFTLFTAHTSVRKKSFKTLVSSEPLKELESEIQHV